MSILYILMYTHLISCKKRNPAECCRLTLTLRCIHDANEMSKLVFSIGACEELQELRLDLDTTLACGGDMVAAVAKMLHRLAKTPKLEALSLGYSWFSDASDETLQDLRDAWKNLEHLRTIKQK